MFPERIIFVRCFVLISLCVSLVVIPAFAGDAKRGQGAKLVVFHVIARQARLGLVGI